MKTFICFAIPLFVSLNSAITGDFNDRLAAEGKKFNQYSSFLPQQILFDGTKYKFDQTFLEDKLISGLSDCKSALAAKNADKISVSEAALAYGVMSAGQFASGTKRVMDLLDQIQQLLGKEKLPYGVSSPYYQMIGMVSQSFKNDEGEPLDVDFVHLGPSDFRSLILQAKMQISARPDHNSH